MKFKTSFFLILLLILSDFDHPAAAQSPKIYAEPDVPTSIIPMCVIYECVEVGSAGASETGEAKRERRLEISKTRKTESKFEIDFKPGILGVDTDLSEQLGDFSNFEENFGSSLKSSLDASGSTNSSADWFSAWANGGLGSEYQNSPIETPKTPLEITIKAWEDWSMANPTAAETVIDGVKFMINREEYFREILDLVGAEHSLQNINAVAHASVSAHLVLSSNKDVAEFIGIAAEIDQNGRSVDSAKDGLNNSVGIATGMGVRVTGGDHSDIAPAVARAFANGELWVSDGNRIYPSGEGLKLSSQPDK